MQIYTNFFIHLQEIHLYPETHPWTQKSRTYVLDRKNSIDKALETGMRGLS